MCPPASQVCSGTTGHTEAVQVTYNPEEVSYQQLVDLFYKGHDATTLNRQKGDAGTQYRSGIYTHDQAQLQVRAGRLCLAGFWVSGLG